MARKPRTLDGFPALDVAALDLITSLDPRNLADGTSATVHVSREHVNALRAALGAKYPGAVDRVYLIRRRQAS
jgi:hypothetical protein